MNCKQIKMWTMKLKWLAGIKASFKENFIVVSSLVNFFTFCDFLFPSYSDMNSEETRILYIWEPSVEGPLKSRSQSTGSATNNAYSMTTNKYCKPGLSVLFSQRQRYTWSLLPVLKKKNTSTNYIRRYYEYELFPI